MPSNSHVFSNRILLLSVGIILSTLLPTGSTLAAAPEKKGEAAPPAEKPSVEYLCETDLFYSWRRVPPKGQTEEGKEPADLFKEIEVYVGKEQATGENKAAVENVIRSRLSGFQAQAMKVCQDKHENQTKCFSTNLIMLNSNLREMDFEARRELRSQINLDCQRNSGVCLSSRASEVACLEQLTSSPAPEKSEEKP